MKLSPRLPLLREGLLKSNAGWRSWLVYALTSAPCVAARRWAFSIWGFIFLLQGLGTIYQLSGYHQADGWKARIVNAIGELQAAQHACSSLQLARGTPCLYHASCTVICADWRSVC